MVVKLVLVKPSTTIRSHGVIFDPHLALSLRIEFFHRWHYTALPIPHPDGC
uniref:Uncharacterized protein n=1 Tax=Anguilla anguilla TaxID=7936 RepID=A0A0E9SNS1_ANGAN